MPACMYQNGRQSVITLDEQLAYFKEYTDRLKIAKGEAAAEEIISEALYIWSIGTNDFIENYYNLPERRMQYTVGEYEAYLLGLAEAAIRRVHTLGGRKMDFTGLTPMGCLPAERIGNRDNPGECNEQYNAVARTFNAKLQELVLKLNKELLGLQLVFADTYQLLANVVNRPADYGEHPSIPFKIAMQGVARCIHELPYAVSINGTGLCTAPRDRAAAPVPSA
jgi:phospholipase/lecithinase/hemolysin